MTLHRPRGHFLAAGVLVVVAASVSVAGRAGVAQRFDGFTAFTNANVIDVGAGEAPRAVAGTIVVRAGRVVRIAPQGTAPPAEARVVDLTGQFVVPGFVNAHAHISDVQGLKPRAYTEENARRQLALYARYGITTVLSLGGEQAPAFALRDGQNGPTLDRARIFLSGEIITARTAEEARQAVARVATTKPDIIKIRVDDNLGSTTKMPPEVYRAVIDEAHKLGQRVAAHIFYLDDAKELLRAGVDMIAHSIRDRDLDDETIGLLKARNVPYCPTLTREIAVFAYETTPKFFSDPFFLKEADRDVMAQLQQPARMLAMAASASAQRYKAGLIVAMRNLKKAADAGVIVVMGTDTGAAPERFQGYFEHLEMWMMGEAGLAPAQVLRASTVNAASSALRREDIGTLATGRWADFVVLSENPLTDIRRTQSLSSVWIAGNPVPAAR